MIWGRSDIIASSQNWDAAAWDMSFRRWTQKLKRSVALKVMNQKVASSRNSQKMFVREARAMAALHHDNVVTIFEVGKSDDTPFMAMELLKGQTLEQRNRSAQQLNYQQIIDYARQIATGLAFAHEKGIIHRDIKPANIWIEEGTERIKNPRFWARTGVKHR